MSVPGRRAALLVVALVVGFQLPGIGRDGLLSDASALRGLALWRDDMATVWAPSIVNDYVRYFAPWAAFLRRTLRAGTLPLWNPYVGTGVPVAEALQPALFHPFTLVLVALPVEHALTVLALARLALAGLGAFVLVRTLGGGAAAATLAGVLWGLAPLHLALRFHTLPNVSACLPWLLAIGERRLAGAPARRTLAAWALVAALACLGGHSQTTVHVLGAALAYHLLRSAGCGVLAREMRFIAAALPLAALAALVAVWGHGEIVLDGFARTFREFRGSYPRLAPAHALSFLGHLGTSGVQAPGWIGLVALVLAAGGAAGRAAFPAWPWVILTLGAAAVAYGIPPISSAVARLPVVGLADHSRLLLVAHLGIAVLAARGVEASADPRARRAMVAAVAVLAAALVALAARSAPARALLVGAASLGFAITMLALSARRARLARAAGWLAVAFVVADLWGAYGPIPRGGVRAMPPVPPALAPLAGRGGGPRALIADAVLPPNVAAFWDVPGLAAFEPSMSDATVQLLVHAGLRPSFHLGVIAGPEVRPAALRVLDLLGAGTLVLPGPAVEGAVRARLSERSREPVAVYENPHALPRVFAAAEARVAADAAAALALVSDPATDLARTVVLEAPAAAPPPAPDARARAEDVAWAPGRVRARTTCNAPCWLVLTETFAPGWRATVDGRPAPVLRADRALVAVAAPAGTHELTLAYRPASVVVGGPVSLVVLAALAAAAIRRPRLARGEAGR